LNAEDYEGAPTRFAISRSIEEAKEGEAYPFLDVFGETGTALIFRHELMHTGGRVCSGRKYILRLDLAYDLDADLDK
jgi:hypothetical protein